MSQSIAMLSPKAEQIVAEIFNHTMEEQDVILQYIIKCLLEVRRDELETANENVKKLNASYDVLNEMSSIKL
jgi:DNA anti-recombination protein RmuC